MEIWWGPSSEICMAGFHGEHFVAKNHRTGREMMRVSCKGHRRPWFLWCPASDRNESGMALFFADKLRTDRKKDNAKRVQDMLKMLRTHHRLRIDDEDAASTLPLFNGPLRCSFHGRSTTSIAVARFASSSPPPHPSSSSIENSRSRDAQAYVITGSEDQTLRTHLLRSSRRGTTLLPLARIEGQISSVRAICVDERADRVFVFSGGGNSSTVAWELLECGQMNHLCEDPEPVSSSKRCGAKRSLDDPNALAQRILACVCISSGALPIVATSDSSGQVRLLKLVERTNSKWDRCGQSQSIVETWSHAFEVIGRIVPNPRPALCIASVNLRMRQQEEDSTKSGSLLIAGYTDGTLCLLSTCNGQDLTRREDERMRIIYKVQAHRSGVNCCEVIECDFEDEHCSGRRHLLVVTGGDDGALCFALVKLEATREGSIRVASWRSMYWASLSACCFTALRMNRDVIVASGSEQRLFVFAVRDVLDEMKKKASSTNATASFTPKIPPIFSAVLDVADVQSLEIFRTSDREFRDPYISVVAVGDGVQCLSVPLS
eukprot:g1128.t1